eukprot:TRINITY_DN41155_c0_g1_i2.p4 TRINITY_DN41155_c0_g1~~TRINITY_DN41155_c0_g1_i2.p4  ORF type:complete len:136 (-),score=44.15 TRINITY_DN41155_c0_g1_i2:61-468(-)
MLGVGDAGGVLAGPDAADEVVGDAGFFVDAGVAEDVGFVWRPGVDGDLVEARLQVAEEEAGFEFGGVGDEVVIEEEFIVAGGGGVVDGERVGAAELPDPDVGGVAFDVFEVEGGGVVGGDEAVPVSGVARGGVVG